MRNTIRRIEAQRDEIKRQMYKLKDDYEECQIRLKQVDNCLDECFQAEAIRKGHK